MWFGFKDDVMECDQCGAECYAGDYDYIYRWRKGVYCSSDCLKEAWHEALDGEVEELDDGVHWREHVVESWDDLDDLWEEVLDPEIELVDLWTAEDKAYEWADREYDYRRDMEA